MSDPLVIKYEVDILEYEQVQRITSETKAALLTAGMVVNGKVNIKGVSTKMLRRMKKEYVTCPVLKKDVTFLRCFICPNFQSRVRGKVLCKGNPLKD